ncbi:MAG: 5-oxoprolinase subunit PxpB [Luteimonas sp.]
MSGFDQHIPKIELLGEDALLVQFGNSIDADLNIRVHALALRIESARPAWLCEIVPSYASLALFVDLSAFSPTVDAQEEATTWLQQLIVGEEFAGRLVEGRLVTVNVRYGGENGPDLAALAAHAGMSVSEVIERHVAVEYRVAMIGFAPGFPYLLGLDPALAMPRLQTPRTRVAAGSVGIGGDQTGIYPRPGPGGWRIIGRTTQSLFDPQRNPPSLLAAGDRVRFVAADSFGEDVLL